MRSYKMQSSNPAPQQPLEQKDLISADPDTLGMIFYQEIKFKDQSELALQKVLEIADEPNDNRDSHRIKEASLRCFEFMGTDHPFGDKPLIEESIKLRLSTILTRLHAAKKFELAIGVIHHFLIVFQNDAKTVLNFQLHLLLIHLAKNEIPLAESTLLNILALFQDEKSMDHGLLSLMIDCSKELKKKGIKTLATLALYHEIFKHLKLVDAEKQREIIEGFDFEAKESKYPDATPSYTAKEHTQILLFEAATNVLHHKLPPLTKTPVEALSTEELIASQQNNAFHFDNALTAVKKSMQKIPDAKSNDPHPTPFVHEKKIVLDGATGDAESFPPLIDELKAITKLDLTSYTSPGKIDFANLCKQFLVQNKIIDEDEYLVAQFQSGNSTTELFTHTLDVLKGQYPAPAGKHTILFPVPGYGYFALPIFERGISITPIVLTKENNFKVTAEQLSNVTKKTLHDLFVDCKSTLRAHYALYLEALTKIGLQTDQLPPLLLEQNTTREECEASLIAIKTKVLALAKAHPVLAEKIARGNFVYGLPPIPEIPRILALFFTNPSAPLGKTYSQAEVDAIDVVRRQHQITVIEDLVHHFILFKGLPGHFGYGKKPTQQITLIGLSKSFCIPGLRAGAAFVSDDFTQLSRQNYDAQYRACSFAEKIMWEQVFVSPIVDAVLARAFNPDAHNSLKSYFAANANNYCYRSELITLMVQGVNRTHLPKEHFPTLFRQIVNHSPTHLERAIKGIPGLDILTSPDATFFLLLDFSSLKERYLGTRQLITSMDFQNALYATVNLTVLGGEGLLYKEKPIARMSVGRLRGEELFNCINRFYEFTTLLRNKPIDIDNPEQRLFAPEKPIASYTTEAILEFRMALKHYSLFAKQQIVADALRKVTAKSCYAAYTPN